MSEVQNPKPLPAAPKRKSGVIVPHAAKWHQRRARLVFVLLRALMLTVRCRLRDRSEFLAPNAPAR